MQNLGSLWKRRIEWGKKSWILFKICCVMITLLVSSSISLNFRGLMAKALFVFQTWTATLGVRWSLLRASEAKSSQSSVLDLPSPAPNWPRIQDWGSTHAAGGETLSKLCVKVGKKRDRMTSSPSFGASLGWNWFLRIRKISTTRLGSAWLVSSRVVLIWNCRPENYTPNLLKKL